jgi:hypothetical protein
MFNPSHHPMLHSLSNILDHLHRTSFQRISTCQRAQATHAGDELIDALATLERAESAQDASTGAAYTYAAHAAFSAALKGA